MHVRIEGRPPRAADRVQHHTASIRRSELHTGAQQDRVLCEQRPARCDRAVLTDPMFDVVLVHPDFDQCARLPPHPSRVGERARRLDVGEPLQFEDVPVLAEPTGEPARVHVRGDPLQPRNVGAGVVRPVAVDQHDAPLQSAAFGHQHAHTDAAQMG